LGRPWMLCGFNGKIGRENSFNNDAKYEGVTSDTPLSENCEKVWRSWLYHDHAWVKIGSGHDAFMKGKQLLQNWRVCFFLPSLNSITKKNYSHSWYLVCIYAHGMISLNCSDDEILETNCLDCE
jgi:hypothetical protein